MDEQKKKWREQMKDAPIKSCGRLDGATYLCSEVTVGRVESDVVRYVYFEDGREVICVGELADFVAFRAADYFDAIEDAVTDERERIAREIEALPRTHSVVDGYRPSVLVVDVLRVVRGEASPEPTREQLEVCPGVLYDGKHFLAGTHAVKGTLKVWSTFEDAVKAAWAERGRG